MLEKKFGFPRSPVNCRALLKQKFQCKSHAQVIYIIFSSVENIMKANRNSIFDYIKFVFIHQYINIFACYSIFGLIGNLGCIITGKLYFKYNRLETFILTFSVS